MEIWYIFGIYFQLVWKNRLKFLDDFVGNGLGHPAVVLVNQKKQNEFFNKKFQTCRRIINVEERPLRKYY